MNNSTSNATQTPENNGGDRDWFDIVLPALGIGFIFLVCLVFFNYAIKVIKNFKSHCCCCGTGLEAQERTASRGQNNPENINDDLPPSYSIAGLGRSSVEVFRVIPDDVSDVSYWQRTDYEINEKLPTYLEIMEEKQLKAANLGATEVVRTSSDEPESAISDESPDRLQNPNSSSMRLPHATVETNEDDAVSETSNEPPPYEIPFTGSAL